MEDNMKEFLETPAQMNESSDVMDKPAEKEKTTEQVVTGDKNKDTVTPTDREAHTIPINALLDEREKRQTAQRELEEARKQLSQYERSQAPESNNIPIDQWVEERVLETKLQLSQFQAEKDYGKELVKEAHDWFGKTEENQAASWKFKNSASPFHDAVEYYKKAKLVEDFSKDPEAYIDAQLAARQNKSSSTTKEIQSHRSPPPSTASKANASRGVSQKLGGFDSLFNK